MLRVQGVEGQDGAGQVREGLQEVADGGDLAGLRVHGDLPGTVPRPWARAATRCGAFPSFPFVPRTVFPSMAMTSLPPGLADAPGGQTPSLRR